MKSKRIGLTTKTVVIFTLILLAVNFAVGALLVSQSRYFMRQIINDRMLSIVKTAASMLDGNELAALTEADDGGEKQLEIIDTLQFFSENMDFEFIYIVRPKSDGTFVFIADADTEEPAAFGEEVVRSEALIAAGNGKLAVDSMAVGDRWGKFYTAYCPVMTSDGKVGGIVGVDFDADWYESQMSKNTVYLLLSGAVSLIIGGGIVLLTTSRLRRRFDELNEDMVTLSGDLGALISDINSEAGYSAIAPEANLLEGIENNSESSDGVTGSVEKLSKEISTIKQNLKRYIIYVHKQAYTDVMTGVGNKTAYLERVREYNEKIENGTANFSIAVFDVNGLKTVNDDRGHAEGDGMIVETSDCIKTVFGEKNVFRIGGDEFIAVLDDYSEEDMEAAFAKLEEKISGINAELSETEKVLVSFSKGAATYRSGEDKEFREVFKRADDEMYKNKDTYYKEFGNRRNGDR